ncbi:glutathione transferase GstA [Legionella hackeliae]|uniref:Glutathione S-transferase n=1 Tax=Legionella hackeliae TaxID=449 RepID=A0A0A8UWR0_LEGHA|nr:glutathione transferase GstA [Legionella hackeliae]KTD15446.1 glutathione S-transferase [Legionella hackeliae]CEK11184.1 Glutathione S-transferase [Legionella hackeliae]STX47950.1 glutathione S-transferase [Legionella hackeliae]
MKLFFTKGACSLAVRIVINEIGIDCDYEAVNLKTKRTEEDRDFLKINPKGAVPTLELDGQILTENAVIQQFLADKFQARDLLPPVGDFKRYQILEWVNFITTELHKSFSNLFNPTIPQEMKDKVYIPMIKTKLGYIDKHLKHKFLMGEQFTLPDAYMFVMLLWAKNFKIDLSGWDHLPGYFTNLHKRPAIVKSLKEETLEIA